MALVLMVIGFIFAAIIGLVIAGPDGAVRFVFVSAITSRRVARRRYSSKKRV